MLPLSLRYVGPFAATTLALLLAGYSSGPTSQAGDLTGSPVQSRTCSGCHNGGNYSPTTNISLLDAQGVPATEYLPGLDYTLRISVSGADEAGGYGLQAVVLDGANAQAGEVGELTDTLRVSSFARRQYIEHTRRLARPVVDVPWQAPAAGTGMVTVYAAGNAVDGSGGTGNDNVALGTLALAEGTTSSTHAVLAPESWRAYHSGGGSLRVLVPDAAPEVAQLLVTDASGRVLHQAAYTSDKVALSAAPQLLQVSVLGSSGDVLSTKQIMWSGE